MVVAGPDFGGIEADCDSRVWDCDSRDWRNWNLCSREEWRELK